MRKDNKKCKDENIDIMIAGMEQDQTENIVNESEPQPMHFEGFATAPKTILEAVKRVALIAEDSQLDPDIINHLAPELEYIAKRLEITEQEALVFAACVSFGTECVDLGDLVRFFDIDRIDSICFVPQLDALARYNLIKLQRCFSEMQFIVPMRILRLLSKNGKYKRPKFKGLNTDEFLNRINKNFAAYRRDELSKQQFLDEVNFLVGSNKKCPVVNAINSVDTHDSNRLVLMLLCAALVVADQPEVAVDRFDVISEDECEVFTFIESLTGGTNTLFAQGYVLHPCSDGFEDTSSLSLTEKARNMLLPGKKLPKSASEIDMTSVVKAGDIKPKTLFYAAEAAEAVDELTDFFTQDRYTEIVKRMRDSNMRCAFTCLFYGGPGTGKTETAYQLARLTGRDIFVVDLSTIKDKWVGESEKNVKAIFDRYRELAKRSEVTPILLLNEADGILSRRFTAVNHSTDQMVNTMQNIILQEMESLDGILIATTNLTGNLDDAFERRFLYKVQFDRPDAHARGNIWRAMLPDLPDDEAGKLATAFDFSGGEIENVVRKFCVNTILHGNDPEHRLDTLFGICSREKLTSGHRAVGF